MRLDKDSLVNTLEDAARVANKTLVELDDALQQIESLEEQVKEQEQTIKDLQDRVEQLKADNDSMQSV